MSNCVCEWCVHGSVLAQMSERWGMCGGAGSAGEGFVYFSCFGFLVGDTSVVVFWYAMTYVHSLSYDDV